jgi:hypothetical protein
MSSLNRNASFISSRPRRDFQAPVASNIDLIKAQVEYGSRGNNTLNCHCQSWLVRTWSSCIALFACTTISIIELVLLFVSSAGTSEEEGVKLQVQLTN